jgi:hypothetical protein
MQNYGVGGGEKIDLLTRKSTNKLSGLSKNLNQPSNHIVNKNYYGGDYLSNLK